MNERFEKPLKHFDTSGIMDTTIVEGPETVPTVGALPPGPGIDGWVRFR